MPPWCINALTMKPRTQLILVALAGLVIGIAVDRALQRPRYQLISNADGLVIRMNTRTGASCMWAGSRGWIRIAEP